MSNTVFFLEKKMRVVAWFWIAGALLNLTLNTWFVPYFAGKGDAAQGAAIAQVSSFAAISVGIFFSSRRSLPMPMNWWRLGISFLLVLMAGWVMHPAWSDNAVYSLLAKMPVGLTIAAMAGGIIAPDWNKRAFLTLRRLITEAKVR